MEFSVSSNITAENAQNVIEHMTNSEEAVPFTTHADELWCRFFSDGFFGFEKDNFHNFTLAHFIPLILFGVAIFLIWKYRAFFRTWKFEENFRFICAAIMILVEMSYFWRLLYVGSGETGQIVSLLDKLPLQVCEWTCIICAFMVMKKKNNWMFQVCFFVCLIAGTCALAIPDTAIGSAGPTYYRYYQFWLEHMLPMLAVFYMVFVHGFRPKFRGIFISVGFLTILGIIAIILNASLPKEHNPEYLYFYLFEGVPIIGKPWVTPIFFAILVFSGFFGLYYLSKLIMMLRRKYVEKKALETK